MNITGRFAPSPTGPLHFGSLVAAVGSFLFARAAGGRWLVRIEDIDTPRVVPGSEQEILAALLRYGLEWDGEVVRQSERTSLYAAALDTLRAKGLAYDCGCSRADPECQCRHELRRVARAVRFRAPDAVIAFDDRIAGRFAQKSDDFVIKRADGLFAYQLAVVVDDAEQGVTQVVRGADLLDSTPRQIALQRALDLPSPVYAHLPLVLGPDGRKIGKRDGALPLPTLDPSRIRDTLAAALRFLGLNVEPGTPAEMLATGIRLTRERRYATIDAQTDQQI
ncbi:MAG TPA: tRNA glutamyl-Q(34) synthetase GluQRS [Thermoanaerobaculia bacterium]|nr:tRNA glutamyl-Q(34) synthetase GluQRS [Thermoanaerobaculia bacterium]